MHPVEGSFVSEVAITKDRCSKVLVPPDRSPVRGCPEGISSRITFTQVIMPGVRACKKAKSDSNPESS
jgi:hypothetical protein